jgi:hypothetical protein
LRGIAPFAGANVTWFGGKEPDILTFYSYWTGFFDAEAKLHWVVRRDTGTQGSAAVKPPGPRLPSQGQDVPAQPEKAGATTWLWSDRCPALVEAMESFEIGQTGFSAAPYPPMKPMPPDGEDVVVISSRDFHSMTFWAQLASTRIETKGAMPVDGAGGLVFRTISIFDGDGCTMTAEPEIPKPTG